MYYSLLMLDRQVEITTETAAIYKENVRVMEAMKIAGMTTEAAVARCVLPVISRSFADGVETSGS